MIGVSEASKSVDWLNISYVLTATVIAAGVIVRSVQKMVRKVMVEVIDDRVRPHLEADDKRFAEIREQLAEIRGQRRRNQP